MSEKSKQFILKLKCIEKESTCYISTGSNSAYSSSYIPNFLFNGKKPIKTNKSEWHEIEFPILKIEKISEDTYENYRYELKSGYPESELTPPIIKEYSLEDTKYEEVSGLYIRKYDTIKGGLEAVEFEIETIATRNKNFEMLEIPKGVSFGLIEQIETNPALLFEKPCQLGGKILYEIVKEHLRQNVDPKVAIVENGYSWRIKVDKLIRLASPYTTTYDANYAKRTKRKDIREKLHRERSVEVLLFEDSSSTKKFPPTIYGEDVLDLQNKLTEYLDGLIEMINTPYVECECCGGYGVIRV